MEAGSLPPEVLDEARATLLGRRNILVSGGTGSGKTTLLNALVELLPDDDRIVSIEDTLELRIDRKNCVRFEARGIDTKSVTIRDLVRHALRHRPDHIVVGEVRGGEAADLLQALNTGHGGSLTTIHANNAESALSRLATCAMQGESDLPWEVTCRGVVDGISMVIHMTRRARGSGTSKKPFTWAITTPQSGAGTTGPLRSPTLNSNSRRCGDARQRCQDDETEASRDCQGDASTGSRIQRGKESLVNGPDLAGKT